MPSQAQYREHLTQLSDDDVEAYLSSHSNLPGPRGNLSLLEAFARSERAGLAARFASSDDEFVAACGAAALGPLLATASGPERAELLDALRRVAGDERWRVREGAAMALQFLADTNAAAARDLARSWLTADDPLVLRAAIAGLCEPRLLRDEKNAALALEACELATEWLRAVPAERRRDANVRVLRQGLAYCWSVAVAASPAAGLPAFAALDTNDADVAWLVKSNRAKKRLAVLLDTADAAPLPHK